MKAIKHVGFIAFAIVAALISLTLCACDDIGYDGKMKLDYPFASSYTISDRGEVFDVSSISAIDVEWINGEVNIVADESATTIGFYELAEGEEPTQDRTLHYFIDNNTLRLKYAKSGKFKLGKLTKKLYVTVPTSARFWLIDVETVSGIVNVNCDAQNVDIDSVSGNVTVNGEVSSVEVESVAADIEIACDMSLAKLDIENVSGNVHLFIPENKGFQMEFDTVSGKLYSSFSNQMIMNGNHYLYLGGGANIEIETVSGSLTLSKLEI